MLPFSQFRFPQTSNIGNWIVQLNIIYFGVELIENSILKRGGASQPDENQGFNGEVREMRVQEFVAIEVLR